MSDRLDNYSSDCDFTVEYRKREKERTGLLLQLAEKCAKYKYPVYLKDTEIFEKLNQFLKGE